MVTITKVYTRQGDGGYTALSDQKKVSKADDRVDALGEVDELNSSLGIICALLIKHHHDSLIARLSRIQHELFNLGAYLSYTRIDNQKKSPSVGLPQITQLEQEMDMMNHTLPSLCSFVLPGGSEVAAQCYLARAVCRRAERALVRLAVHESSLNLAIAYLNRLSDWLFVSARYLNQQLSIPESLWNPS
ncbi:MAG: ATP:cob(I)alamin adenosyltransferase [Coxiella sp. RIFCSPHIGHO2_12_FULL_44_14]|nr:MAG: ATP:cob(I)alamin adenosyltransferase [Coxiella sp. RIFCSPHIGHO2_12_FULL_44_14]